MKIQNTGVEFQRSGVLRGTQSGATEAGKKQAPQQAGQAAARNDSVEISAAARALASQQTDAGARPELSAERIGEIRNRVMQGAYNSLEVVDQVARRMLQSGDI